MEEGWRKALEGEFNQEYFVSLVAFLRQEYTTQKIYPPGPRIFAAFDYCPFEKTKVVILGQDPYHGVNQANGLAFSVSNGIRTPPSLVNIFKEVKTDTGAAIPTSGNLERWASQGVLLLNTALTVREGTPLSHTNKGWEKFTDAVIHLAATQFEHLVFILWGSPAQKKAVLPAPLSVGLLRDCLGFQLRYCAIMPAWRAARYSA